MQPIMTDWGDLLAKMESQEKEWITLEVISKNLYVFWIVWIPATGIGRAEG